MVTGSHNTRLAVLGLVLILLGLLLAPGYSCSDVGYYGEPPGGVQFEGIENGALLWTPDGGVNSCRISVGILLIPAGILSISYAALDTLRQ